MLKSHREFRFTSRSFLPNKLSTMSAINLVAASQFNAIVVGGLAKEFAKLGITREDFEQCVANITKVAVSTVESDMLKVTVTEKVIKIEDQTEKAKKAAEKEAAKAAKAAEKAAEKEKKAAELKEKKAAEKAVKDAEKAAKAAEKAAEKAAKAAELKEKKEAEKAAKAAERKEKKAAEKKAAEKPAEKPAEEEEAEEEEEVEVEEREIELVEQLIDGEMYCVTNLKADRNGKPLRCIVFDYESNEPLGFYDEDNDTIIPAQDDDEMNEALAAHQ